jgi:hypothetical protein
MSRPNRPVRFFEQLLDKRTGALLVLPLIVKQRS